MKLREGSEGNFVMFLKTNETIYPKLPENNMQFLVYYTLHEIIFNRINQKIKKEVKKDCSCKHISESNEISISSKLGTVPLHQLFEALHKIDKMLDKVQAANTFPNQHSCGVKLPKLGKN